MVRVQQGDFDMAAEYAALRDLGPGVGAVVTFVGLVRDFDRYGAAGGESVDSLYLQHYPGKTEAGIEAIVAEACERWPVEGASVIHRVGELLPGDQIVFVGTAAAHRSDAFAAAEFIMDYLKTRAAFWKKTGRGGDSRWLDMHRADREAARRWESK